MTKFRIRNIIFPPTSSHSSVRVSSPTPGLYYSILVHSVYRVTVGLSLTPDP